MAQQSRDVDHHKRGKAAAAVIAASTAQTLASKQFGKSKTKKPRPSSDTRKLGGTVMKIYQKDSQEILDQFGTADDSFFDDEESGLSVPGMKREFKLERVEQQTSAKESNLSENTSSFTTSIDQQHQDQQPQDMASIYSRISSRQASRPVSALSQGGEIHSFGELMKGMQTTSKLVGKLHTLRAAGNDENQGGGAGGSGGGAGSGSFGKNGEDPDDRWDWMTGVPTSIRFVAKSWRSVARGPGGIVTESPLLQVKNESRWKSITTPDFAGTVNMLTVLAKVSA